MPLIASDTADTTSAAVLLPDGGLYQLSLESAGAASSTFETRQGDSGSWHPINDSEGTPIALTASSGNKVVRLPGSSYIRSTVTGAAATAYTILASRIEE